MTTSTIEADCSRETVGVAVVVVTYNRKSLLRQCLEALRDQTHPIAELIVVDNASTDGTAAMVRADFSDVTLRVLDENRGGAGGFHEGMKMAVCRDVEWIWVMDDDVEPKHDALQRLLSSQECAAKNTVGLASLKVGDDGNVQRSHAGRYDPVCMTRSVAKTEEGSTRIQFSSFVGLMVQRTAIEKIGFPEGGFFIRDDDIEFSLRLSSVGEVYLVPESIVVHHNSRSRKGRNTLLRLIGGEPRPLSTYWKRYYGIRNSILVLYRHTDLMRWRMVGICRAAMTLLKEVLVVLLRGDQRYKQLSLLFTAFLHGVQGKSGHYIHPEDFPQQLHPEALHPFDTTPLFEEAGVGKRISPDC